MKELIASFVPEQFAYPEIFMIDLAGITYPFSSYRVKREHSTVYSIEYVLEGTGTVHCDHQTYFPRAGTVYLLPKGHDHHYWSDPSDPFHKIWINVRGSLCDSLYQTYQLQPGVICAPDTLPLFEKLVTLCRDGELGKSERTYRTMALFQELCLQLFQQQAQQKQPTQPESVACAKEFLDEHLGENVTIQQVARHVNLSASQLTRQFRKAYGQAPYDYYLAQKLQLAQTLLAQTTLSIKEIADRLAFADEHYFAKLFKQKLGQTPYQWKKARKETPPKKQD